MTIEYEWTGRTNVGVSRTQNQDAVMPDGNNAGATGIAAVADGLGGHPGGDVASQAAIAGIAASPPDSDAASLVRAGHDAIMAEIAAAMGDEPALLAMATTLTVAVLAADGVVEIGHVGDSRAYISDRVSIQQVTDDHTHGMDRVTAGELTLEEAREEEDWHVLSNWLGFENYRVSTYVLQLTAGDRLLLCTDGLSNMLTDDEINDIVKHGDSESTSEALVSAANDAGGADNITVVVVDVVTT